MGSKAREGAKAMTPRVLRLYCWISSMRVSEEERSVRDVSRTRTTYSDFLLHNNVDALIIKELTLHEFSDVGYKVN